MAAFFVSGFTIDGFIPVFFSAIVLRLESVVLKAIVRDVRG